METNLLADESLPDNIPDVEALIASYNKQLETMDETIAKLRASEDFKNGVFFAKEIHEALQLKNRYTVERQFAKNRLNRLRMEQEPF
ncbi:hypothetical protein [Oleidesulfovibrio sp.]|uniref:hypothetical protein n=1 Tax=Oleidesulfovibrio sp. TaxID=2909707 RepID=UPI003A88A1E9